VLAHVSGPDLLIILIILIVMAVKLPGVSAIPELAQNLGSAKSESKMDEARATTAGGGV
jgi:Sec-independent protein translocase protein TatA